LDSNSATTNDANGADLGPPDANAPNESGAPPNGRPVTPVDRERWLSLPGGLDGLDDLIGGEGWAGRAPVVRLPQARSRLVAETRRANRRRRRYSFFVRRSSRARQAARSATIARAAWATALVMLLTIVAVVSTAVGAAASYYHSEQALLRGLPNQILSQDSLRIYDSKGVLLYEVRDYGAQRSISLAQVPVSVVNATVAIEDHDFWVNQGVDFTSILRALSADLKSGQITQGGSTITQQLIKQQVLKNPKTTFTRKLEEAILAFGMTTEGTSGYSGFSKRQILEMYLNSIGYSPTAYGIEAAAQEYFGYTADPATGMTAAQHLDLAQASMLAGIPQNPNANDPLAHFAQARDRQKQVLQAMVDYGYIPTDQANAAYREASQPNFFHPTTSDSNLAPHFVAYVRSLLEAMINTGQLGGLSRSGLNVYTTLDLDLQNHAQQAMREHLYGDDPTGYCCALIRNSNVTNAAEIMADQHTGAIKVYLGSIDYYSSRIDGKYDVVSGNGRPPGSSFKPYVYATAFEKGWFPAITVNDVPSTFWDTGSGNVYRPLDFTSDEARGRVTLRTAIDWSLNIPAVKVMQFAGVDDVKAQAERMGITSAKGTWGLSSVLGALSVNPYEMAQAYTVFANYGQYIPLHAIDRITDSAGNVLFNYIVPRPVQVLDPRIAFQITSILTDNASREGDFGGCSPLYLAPYFGTSHPHYQAHAAYGTAECSYMQSHNFLSPNAWPVAAKTGTGQDFKDDWTMGYTMDYTTAVWVGNNNDTPMSKIDGVTGAAPIWYQSMIYAEASTSKVRTPFPVPAGVSQQRYCSQGVCTTDWFLNGALPPQNLGEHGDGIPCVTLLPQGGWDYSSGGCDVALIPGRHQNIGAPKTVQYVGAP
jgi:membrane peptidoglycan carboxypeptidase